MLLTVMLAVPTFAMPRCIAGALPLLLWKIGAVWPMQLWVSYRTLLPRVHVPGWQTVPGQANGGEALPFQGPSW